MASQPRAFSFENKVEAVFPEKPEYLGEFTAKKLKQKGYSYSDVNSFLVYTLVLLSDKQTFPENEIENQIGKLIEEYRQDVNGKILSNEIKVNENEKTGQFIIKSKHQKYTIYSYSKVIYDNGYIYYWSVQEIEGLSTVSGKKIFDDYANLFRLIK